MVTEVVREGLGVAEGVAGDQIVPDAVHSLDSQLGLPLEPDRSADVCGVVVYELSVHVWTEEPRGRPPELPTVAGVESPVGAVPVHDVPQLREVVLARGHGHPAVAPARAVPLVKPAKLVLRDPVICCEHGAHREESVRVSLEHQTPGGLGGEQGLPGGHHTRHGELL